MKFLQDMFIGVFSVWGSQKVDKYMVMERELIVNDIHLVNSKRGQ